MDADVIVVGAGPGGYPTAIRAAQLGQRVICIERDRVGGVCLNWGCIPRKALLKTAELVHKMRKASDWGLTVGEVGIDYPAVIGRSRKVAEKFEKGVAHLFKKYGVTHLAGQAVVDAPGRVSVTLADGTVQKLTCRTVVLATGARARVFPGIHVDGERVMTYREAIVSTRRPEKAVVLGAGAIGMEFAWFWHAMGAAVTVVEGRDEILPLEDREAGAAVRKAMEKTGIAFKTGAMVKTVEKQGDGAVVVFDDGAQLQADTVLVALGITPNLEAAAHLGFALERGFVVVDPVGRTNLPGIWAVGDITTRGGLAHTATAQGHAAAEAIAGKHPHPIHFDAIPAATYCQPQVASVGLREDTAKAKGLSYRVGKFPFSANGKAWGAMAADGFVKVLVGDRGEILGATIVGAEATELLPELVLAMTAELTTDELLSAVHAHPTNAEAVFEAIASALGVSVHL